MSKTVINKLVRDKIPEIITHDGKTVTFHKVKDDAEFRQLLKNKLLEEAAEFADAETEEEILEELVDVLEVTKAIKALYGITDGDLSTAMNNKYSSKGGFYQGYILDYIEDQD